MALPPTPSQTIGPFYHFALPFPGGERLVEHDDPDAVRIAGTVYDGAGEPGQPHPPKQAFSHGRPPDR